MKWRRRLKRQFSRWSTVGWAPLVWVVLDKAGALASIWEVLKDATMPSALSALISWFPLLFGFGWLGWLVANPRRVYRLSSLGREGRLLNETFVDATFLGPGALAFKNVVTNSFQTPTVEDVSFISVEYVSDSLGGAVVVDNCQFIRCRFKNVAFIAEGANLDKGRAMLGLEGGSATQPEQIPAPLDDTA